MNRRRRSHFQVEEATNCSFVLVAQSGLWCQGVLSSSRSWGAGGCPNPGQGKGLPAQVAEMRADQGANRLRGSRASLERQGRDKILARQPM